MSRHLAISFAIFWLCGGFLAGTVNAMVLVLIIYAMKFDREPVMSGQVCNTCFLLGKLTKGFILRSSGLLSRCFLTILPVAGVVVIGHRVGLWKRHKMDTATHRC